MVQQNATSRWRNGAKWVEGRDAVRQEDGELARGVVISLWDGNFLRDVTLTPEDAQEFALELNQIGQQAAGRVRASGAKK